ncbi:MAG: cytochrome ubiquinol oxidase subunit I [Acidobacteriota bacterium]|nr:cytochrome ubiquinol oxidase subunit I [Acidobacteriota bacterium]
MSLDPVQLSRLQFAVTIMFHYLFPPLTIGMGVVLVYLEGMYLKTREPVYESAARFWTSLFAVTFAMGVATGIVMEFEFGTNWARYSRFVGDVFGSALAAEGIFAFFLESGFLAVLVFGWDRVTPRFHFFATCMVSLGSMFSAVWIIVANSWQQTPAGHTIVTRMANGLPVTRAETADLLGVILNPSTVDRLVHTLIGAWVLGSFFVMSISAWYLLKGRHEDFARRSFTGALLFATVASLAAAVSGHVNGQMVARWQPAKLAAFEGHFTTGPGDLTLFGIPNEAGRRVDFAPAIPGGLSFLAKDDFHAPVIGLDKIPRQYWPPVTASYMTFHLMVMLGVAFIGLTVLASWLRWRGKLFEQRWLLKIFVFAVAGPVLANELGWAAAEVGRQPWIVNPGVVRDAAGEPALDSAGMIRYKLEEGLLTRDAVSESVKGGEVLASIIMFSAVYGLLLLVWLYVLNDKIQKGPQAVHAAARTTAEGLLDVTSARTIHRESLSEAKDEEEGDEEE